MWSAEEPFTLCMALPSFARALMSSHQRALYWLRKESFLKLRFQTHQEQGMILHLLELFRDMQEVIKNLVVD